jgi:predicted unusual protein kinase regulating ubiquinone biosynthesis (AarF/ABC1/UbiB family)
VSEYRNDVRINKYELEDLWESHSDRFLTWWEKYAEAKRLRNIAEARYELLKKENREELEYIRADLDIQIRRNPMKFNLPKVTDVSVANCILIQDRYRRFQEQARASEKEARYELIAAEHKMDVLKGAAEAFDKRTDSLRALTALMSKGLYSATLPSGPIRTEVEAKRAEAKQQELNERMNQRRSRKDGEREGEQAGSVEAETEGE